MSSNRQESLHQAVNAGEVEAVTLLLNEGVDVNAENSDGDTVLHVVARKSASSYPFNEMIDLLCSKGIDLEKRNRMSECAIHVAVTRDAVDFVKTMIDKDAKQLTFRGREGRLPLFYAVLGGSVKMVAALLDLGADPNQIDRLTRKTSLDVARERKFHKVEAILVQHHAHSATRAPANKI